MAPASTSPQKTPFLKYPAERATIMIERQGKGLVGRYLGMLRTLVILLLAVVAVVVMTGPAEAATIRLYGVEVTGTHFVFVCDASRTMGGKEPTPLATAKAVIDACLAQLTGTEQFSIIVYSNKIQQFGVEGQGRSPNASDENKLAGREFLAEFSPEGEANHNAAVAASISDEPDVVIVLSDGSGEPMTGLELRKFNAANETKAKIYAIEFGYGPPFGLGSFARQLAKENGGKTIYVDLLKK